MYKIWHYSAIRYLQKRGLVSKEIHADKVATLGDDAQALSTVKSGKLNSRGVWRDWKMTQDQDVLPKHHSRKH